MRRNIHSTTITTGLVHVLLITLLVLVLVQSVYTSTFNTCVEHCMRDRRYASYAESARRSLCFDLCSRVNGRKRKGFKSVSIPLDQSLHVHSNDIVEELTSKKRMMYNKRTRTHPFVVKNNRSRFSPNSPSSDATYLGEISDLLKKLIEQKKKEREQNPPKPSQPQNPNPKPDPKPPVVVERTISEEQIWAYFEKLYFTAHTGTFGGCTALTCTMILPEGKNMSDTKHFHYDSFLDTVASKLDQVEPFSKSYEKFLFSLNVPDNLSEKIAKDSSIIEIRDQVRQTEDAIGESEKTCKSSFAPLSKVYPDYETYKSRFCTKVNQLTNTKYALLGKLHSAETTLYDGWEIALEARELFNRAKERSTWKKHISLENIEASARKRNPQSELNIEFNGQAIFGVQDKHAKSGEEIYPDLIRVPTGEKGPTLDFDGANRNISDKQFYARIGAAFFTRVLVQPDESWFSKSAVATYSKRDDYKKDSKMSQRYFFDSQVGALIKYPESVYVMIQPSVQITVSKLTEEYVRRVGRVAIFNFVFDLNANDELKSEPCPISPSDDCVLLTFTKDPSDFTPLLLSVKMNK